MGAIPNSPFSHLDPARAAVAAARAAELAQGAMLVRDRAIAELQAIELEVKRRRWITDPSAWCRERLGDFLWSKQNEILASVRDHRKTLVKSCHEVGKSFIAGRAVCQWLDSNPPGEAFVVTSAPTAPQVEAILWREIGRAHARGGLKGRVTQTEWRMTMSAGNEELIAFGRKPADYDMNAFQGIHAKRVLVVFDEANGMPSLLWEAADSLIANDFGRLLAIGNPDDPTSEFAVNARPGSGYNVITISAFDSPNFTGETVPQDVRDVLIGKLYVEEKRRRWAPTWVWSDDGSRCVPPQGADSLDLAANPFWHSKVLGEFPPVGESGGLVPLSWVLAAQARTLPAEGISELGGDVGGGGDESTCCHRKGGVFRVLWSNRNPDTMQTCGKFIATKRSVDASLVKVDSIGIGRGVADRGKELKEPFVAVNVSERADSEDFLNLRAEGAWNVREMFERGEIDIDPLDEDLAGELVDIRYKRTSSGQIQIESKDEYRRRHNGASPNRFDSLVLAAMKQRAARSATWGR